MKLVRNFLDALDRFIITVREIRFKNRHQGIDHLRERFAVLRLTVFKVLDRPHRLLADIGQVLEFSLQGINFGLQGLVLRSESLHLLAPYLDELGMAFLFGIVKRLFASRFSLHRLDLATDRLHRFLRLGNNARKAQTKENLSQQMRFHKTKNTKNRSH